MGEAIISRRGGGKLFAVIDVSYPAGAVCTCSNGTRTLRARGTGGHFLFNIPTAGDWTVTAVLDGKSKSETVTVSEAAAYSITITYELILFDNGEYAAETGGWNKTGNKLKLSASTTSMNGATDHAYTLNPVDMTDYNTLHFILDSTGSDRNQGRIVGVGTNQTNKDYSAEYSIGNSTPSGEKTLDISQINGAQYVKMWLQAWPSQNGESAGTNMTISKVWLS